MPKYPVATGAESPAPSTPTTPISPLDLILTTMRKRLCNGDTDGAIALALLAAPYLHPRAANAPSTDLADTSDADLDALRPRD